MSPNLSDLIQATSSVARCIDKGNIIIYESTVAPGTTEGLCKENLEKLSGLICDEDFFLAYSPERVSPGVDRATIKQIDKVVSASTEETLCLVSKIYQEIIESRVIEVSSIKIAEAAKMVENIQRDVNIALMNELSTIFFNTEIDFREVLDAASTKWNFMNVRPGFVGGHCIGVDPYYFIDNYTKRRNMNAKLIELSRVINESEVAFVSNLVNEFVNKHDNQKTRIGIFGISYKENVGDIRNSKMIDLCNHVLKSNTFDISIVDFDVPIGKCSKEIEKHRIFELSNEIFDIIVIGNDHDSFGKIEKKWSSMVHPNSRIIDLTGKFEHLFSLDTEYYHL